MFFFHCAFRNDAEVIHVYENEQRLSKFLVKNNAVYTALKWRTVWQGMPEGHAKSTRH